jgi:hypothetical protein
MTATKLSNLLALLVLVAAVFVLVTGCGYRMYWTKPGASASAFTTDHLVCARHSATPMPTKPGYGVVNEKLYRACLEASGWSRKEVQDMWAERGGWFRGIETDDVVRLDAVPEQPRDVGDRKDQEQAGCQRSWPSPADWQQYDACMRASR